MLSILHQYYINTTFSQFNTTQYYKSAFQYYLNTTNQQFNTTSILHCILCNSILPNTTNTTKVQYYISINTTQYYQYYQYYKGQLADGEGARRAPHCHPPHSRPTPISPTHTPKPPIPLPLQTQPSMGSPFPSPVGSLPYLLLP